MCGIFHMARALAGDFRHRDVAVEVGAMSAVRQHRAARADRRDDRGTKDYRVRGVSPHAVNFAKGVLIGGIVVMSLWLLLG
jgi:hypothetical protein